MFAIPDVVEIEPRLHLASYSGLCHIFPDSYDASSQQPRSSLLRHLEHIMPSNACVVTVDSRCLPSTLTKNLADYKFVRSQDDASADLLTYFDEVHAFIARALQNNRNVIVHCNAGVSRSCTLVCAYLMKSRHLDLQQALTHIRDLKADVMPNENFQYQLNLYWKMGWKVDTQSHDFRQYRLKVFAKQSAYQRPAAEGLDELLWSRPRSPSAGADNANVLPLMDAGSVAASVDASMSPSRTHSDAVDGGMHANTTVVNDATTNMNHSDPERAAVLPADAVVAEDPVFSCRMCRSSLFRASGLMLHSRTVPLPAGGNNCAAPSSSSMDPPPRAPTICEQEFYIEPVDWMRDQITGAVEGKLYCFKCEKKIGNFSWIGERCACSTWVQPAFHIHRTKVDFKKDIKADKTSCGRQIM